MPRRSRQLHAASALIDIGSRHDPTPTFIAFTAVCAVLVLVAPVTVSAAPRVQLGVDTLFASKIKLVAGKRVGLITNTSGVDGKGVQTLDRLNNDPRVQLRQLYGPEHGIRLEHGNNHSDRTGVDSVTGIPLQGINCSSAPSRSTLRKLDVLVFDIQDIGSRTYTYVTTMGKAMKAAARNKIPFIVLDRPNPNGGLLFEGPTRQKRHRSVIGWAPIPVTHGMTVGELARWYNKEMRIGAKLTVVPMKGWRRNMVWEDTGLLWSATSTAITQTHHAHLYVATGMLCGAGLNVDDGVAAGRFFERIAGTWVDKDAFSRAMNAAGLTGVRFEPISYVPYKGRWVNKALHGIHLVVTDPRTFRPLRTALTAFTTLRKLHGKKLRVLKKARFGRVWGTYDVLKRVRRGQSVAKIEASWRKSLARFSRSRKKYLLYK